MSSLFHSLLSLVDDEPRPDHSFYRARKKEIDRCRIVYTDPSDIMTGARIHYKNNKFFICKTWQQVPHDQQRCCRELGSAKARIATVLVKYKTKPNGFVLYPLQYEIHPWIFGERIYTILKQAQINYDFKIDCLNEDYQNIKLIPCNDSLWTDQLNQESQDKIRTIYDYARRSIGLNLSLEQIDRLLDGRTDMSPAELITAQTSVPYAPELPIKMTEQEFKTPGKRRIRWED